MWQFSSIHRDTYPEPFFALRMIPVKFSLYDLGLKKILEVGGSLVEIPGSLAVTETTRMSASVLLNKLFDDLKCEAERENFHKLCEDYVR